MAGLFPGATVIRAGLLDSWKVKLKSQAPGAGPHFGGPPTVPDSIHQTTSGYSVQAVPTGNDKWVMAVKQY